MEHAAVTAALVIWVHEQRPDVSVFCVADSKRDDFSFSFDDPATSSLLDRFTDLLIGNRSRNQSILAHGAPNALDIRDVGEDSLP
jgi:hypothetical protein